MRSHLKCPAAHSYHVYYDNSKLSGKGSLAWVGRSTYVKMSEVILSPRPTARARARWRGRFFHIRSSSVARSQRTPSSAAPLPPSFPSHRSYLFPSDFVIVFPSSLPPSRRFLPTSISFTRVDSRRVERRREDKKSTWRGNPPARGRGESLGREIPIHP